MPKCREEPPWELIREELRLGHLELLAVIKGADPDYRAVLAEWRRFQDQRVEEAKRRVRVQRCARRHQKAARPPG